MEGVWYWGVENRAIGGAISSSHAIETGAGAILIDPVRLVDSELSKLAPVAAIVLTARCHQRSCWRYRAQLGVPVWAPLDATGEDEQPDRRYAERELIGDALLPVRTPGPEHAHYAVLAPSRRTLFCPDLLSHSPEFGLAFVPAEYHEQPAETRRSTAALLDLEFDALCFDHGPPLTGDPRTAIEQLLRRT